MSQIINTELWRTTLQLREVDGNSSERERFRNTFNQFRNRASILASEIHSSMPEYTVHDITHLDAMWEMADMIVGSGFLLTPPEAFVLGGAILLHDLGMGISAYPKGMAEIATTELWKDIVANLYLTRYERMPTDSEMLNPLDEIKTEALSNFLRKTHADQAKNLATIYWVNPNDNSQMFLIEDSEIRQTFGRIIGEIANSHWWDIKRIEGTFTRVVGAPTWCPNDWTVDSLKIACILRVADASNIDSRRAPQFLRALRCLKGVSSDHWGFQSKLSKPYLKEDSLCYSSGNSFDFSCATQWWLCYETLKMIDLELRQVDNLLADKGMHRFSARRVFGIESTERLTSLLPVDGWMPFDAFVHVGDIPKIIRSLGGEELYGKNYKAAIRELIQNSTDAIRARKKIENSDDDIGEIVVKFGSDENGNWFEINDNGIGMSIESIKKYLLNFGSSYWDSELLRDEYPGLMSSGIKQTGKYGIGFFSVFMLGDKIEVATRPFGAAYADTLILEFENSISTRPIIRNAKRSEYIRDGGTKVKVWIRNSDIINKIFNPFGHKITFEEVILSIAPSIDTKITIIDEILKVEKSYLANHWLNCSNEEFFEYINLLNNTYEMGRTRKSSIELENSEKIQYEKIKTFLIENTRIISYDQEVFGRACIDICYASDTYRQGYSGIVTAGGLFSNNMNGIFGIMKGKVSRASRDDSEFLVSEVNLANWASKFDFNKVEDILSSVEMVKLTQIIYIMGGRNDTLRPCMLFDKCFHGLSLVEHIKSLEEIIVIDEFFIYRRSQDLHEFTPKSNIILSVISSSPSIILGRSYRLFRARKHHNWRLYNTNLGLIVNAISSAWGVNFEKISEEEFEKLFQQDYIHIGDNGDVEIFESGFIFNKESLTML